jgi:hypothetical protein
MNNNTNNLLKINKLGNPQILIGGFLLFSIDETGSFIRSRFYF